MKYIILFVLIYCSMCTTANENNKTKYAKDIITITSDTIKNNAKSIGVSSELYLYNSTYSFLEFQKENIKHALLGYIYNTNDTSVNFIVKNITLNDFEYIYSNNIEESNSSIFYVKMSNIYYNKLFTKAICLVRLNCGAECGYFRLFIYQRYNKKWSIINTINIAKY